MDKVVCVPFMDRDRCVLPPVHTFRPYRIILLSLCARVDYYSSLPAGASSSHYRKQQLLAGELILTTSAT